MHSKGFSHIIYTSLEKSIIMVTVEPLKEGLHNMTKVQSEIGETRKVGAVSD